MENLKEGLAKTLFGRSRKDPACVLCGNPKVAPEDFRDPLSLKEFTISHMCQKCQDEMFN
jgi:hypothetical protein